MGDASVSLSFPFSLDVLPSVCLAGTIGGRRGDSLMVAAAASTGGSELLNRMRSSMHLYTDPETPSKTRKRSSMLSRVNVSKVDSCSSVRLLGS